MHYATVIVFYVTLLLSPDNTKQCGLLHPVSYTLVDLQHRTFNVTRTLLINGFVNYTKLVVKDQIIPKLCPEILELGTAANHPKVYIDNSGVKEIATGPYSFSGVLGVFSLTRNPLTEIRQGVFNELKVRHLNLSYNEIEWVEAPAFDNNSHLESVLLRGNRLRIINSNWFFNTSFLYKIDLGENKLWTLQAAAFKHLANCSFMSLILDHNQIETIHPGFLKGFRYITLIDMRNNQIGTVPSEFFKSIHAYELLLQNNRMRKLPLNYFQGYPDVIYVDLRKNKFTCPYLSAIKNYAFNRRRVVFASWEECFDLQIGLKYSNWDVYDYH